MQLITLTSIAALVASATASADVTSFNNNATCDTSLPKVRVFNRCSYQVHLWSVLKGQGCPAEDGAILEPGQFYQENFRQPSNQVGVSIKISKESRCKGVDCLQLEYYLEQGSGAYDGNYLDVSYVDCTGGDCPTKQEGYYLKSGNQNGQFMANSNNEHCPILSCSDATECATMSYINPDDVQTKFCSLEADLDFYMCGGEAPGDESYDTPAPSSSAAPSSSSSEEQESSSTPTPSSAAVETPAYTVQEADVAAAEITSAPAESSKVPNIKTEVVYVTKFEYVNAKRHAHGHRHQHFRA